MARLVFSKDISGTWGGDLASTLVEDGAEKSFLDLYAAMAAHPHPEKLQDGDVIAHDEREHMVLELEASEQERLSAAREQMVGSAGLNIMICERIPALVAADLLTADDIAARRARRFEV